MPESEPSPLHLVLVVTDPDLEAEIRSRLDARFVITTVASPEDPAPAAAQTPFTIVALAETQPPGAKALQNLLDLCETLQAEPLCIVAHNAASTVDSLLRLGVHDVLALETLTAEQLLAAARASLARGARIRELVDRSHRHALKWHMMAALAGAGSLNEVIEQLCDGLIALGAVGVTCWEYREPKLRLLTQRGVEIEHMRLGVTISHPEHPAVVSYDDQQPLWLEQVNQVAERYGDFVPGQHKAALGFIPLFAAEPPHLGLSIAYQALPTADCQREIEQLCAQATTALQRAHQYTELTRERNAIRRLLGVVGHDLRNPLSTMTLSLEYFASLLPSEAVPVLQQVRRAIQVATHLTQDLLTFTSLAGDGMRLVRKPIDTFSLLRHCIGGLAPATIEGRTFVVESLAGDGQLQADPVRLEQAIGNLLSNALTYSPPGGQVVVRGHGDAHAVYIEVDNRGAKLAPEHAEKLFAPLSRLSEVSERGSQGLGLFIVDRIMTAHGGRVWLETFGADGVRFCLQLPRQRGPSAEEIVRLEYLPNQSIAETPPVLNAQLSQLAQHFVDPTLRRVLEIWYEAKALEAPMPHPQSVNRSRLLGYLPDMVRARVHLTDQEEPVFHWLEVGPRLERRLGRNLFGAPLAPTDAPVLGSQYDAYKRCWRGGQPVYDYARKRGAQGFGFERLLLPLSRDSHHHVTEIIGLVIFRE